MDAHYDQVMQRRREFANAPSRLYFAYSTILDRQAFVEWRTQHNYNEFDLPPGKVAEAVDIDLVYDFPSRWWGGRVAGLVDEPGVKIYGLLFEIAGPDWPIIEHKEGAITGMTVERDVTVLVDGKEQTATAFTTNPARASKDGAISMRFVEALSRGARSAGLPENYAARLEQIL